MKPWKSRAVLFVVYAGVLALFVLISPAYTMADMSFGSAAYMVVVEVLDAGIDPPLHQIGLLLALLGLVLATRLWAALLGLIGCVLWGWTGMIMTSLLVT